MNSNTNQHNFTNPWNGLKTYAEGEQIYGRSYEIHVLSLLILQSHQTVLYGKSGIGKSSILNAGIFPSVRRKGVFPVYVRLEHRSPTSYLTQIKDAIKREIDKSHGEISTVELVANSTDESLWEFFHRIEYKDKNGHLLKPLIVFDQFEEIFTLESNKEKIHTFFRQLADLLNNVMPENLLQVSSENHELSTDLISEDNDMMDLGFDLFSGVSYSYKEKPDYHFVFTLREDFLSYLERNTVDIPTLKNNRYCLQPINEEQAAEIITQPRPGLIDTSVAKLIIEKVTGETDFDLNGIPEIQVDSAILSLYLSRLYDKMIAENASVITKDLVETYSANIIEDFYADAIKGLDDKSVRWLEDTLINEDGRRDNRDRSTVIRESGLSEDELDVLINDVKLLRQFSYGGDLRIEFIHDVLCPVITARKSKREEDDRISAIAQKALAEKQRSRKRLIAVSVTFILIAFAVTSIWLFHQYMNVWPEEKYYLDYDLRDGWPIGCGPELNRKQLSTLPLYYKLSHPGHKDVPFTKLEVCSSNQILSQVSIKLPFLIGLTENVDSLSSLDFLSAAGGIREIDFIPSAEKTEKPNLDYMAFFTEDGNLSFTLKRSATSTGDWYSFYDDKGSSLPINLNKVDRVKVSQDSLGFIQSMDFYDNIGARRPLYRDVYGFFHHTSSKNDEYITIATDRFNQPINREVNAYEKSYRNNAITTTFYHMDNINSHMVAVNNPKGFSKMVEQDNSIIYYSVGNEHPTGKMHITKDKRGNIVRLEFNNISGILKDIPPITEYIIDENGRTLSKVFLNSDKSPYSPNHSIFKYTYGYTPDGELITEMRFTDKGRSYLYEKSQSNNVTVTKREDLEAGTEYFIQIDSIINDKKRITAFFDADLHPINSNNDNLNYHKVIKTFIGDSEESKYFSVYPGSDILMAGFVTPKGEINADYCTVVETHDSKGNLLSYLWLDVDNNIVQSMRYYYQDGKMIARSAMGIEGDPVRCDEWEEDGFLYYKLLFNKDFNGAWCDFKSINEAGNQSLLKWNDDYMRFGYANFKGSEFAINNIRADALYPGGRIIKDYWQYYPIKETDLSETNVIFAHILSKDNPLYEYGLKDGDIFIECGEWELGQSVKLLHQQLSKHKPLTVMRLDNMGKYLKAMIPIYEFTDKDFSTLHFHEMRLNTEESKAFIQAI